MKKIIIIAAVLITMIGIKATSIIASSPSKINDCPKSHSFNYVDKNNDGICDNKNNGSNVRSKKHKFIDKDGDGICDRLKDRSNSLKNKDRNRNCQNKRNKE